MNEWLSAEIKLSLQSAFQAISGQRPDVDSIEDSPKDCPFLWRQPFSSLPDALWVAAFENPQIEIVKQTLNGIARAVSERLGRAVACEGGEQRSSLPPKLSWTRFDVLSDAPVSLLFAAEPGFLDAISGEAPPPAGETSKTFDLLLDVEMPVSVSFGRAQVPLKDVLKLTTGAIVELNRAIGDPVEVIVNNCVIARGEVVTIEGNFGVRIQQVISRQERLRTLK